MYINIPRFGEIRDAQVRAAELERFLRELVAKINEDTERIETRVIKTEAKVNGEKV
jgi:hypothetical protein